MKDDVSHWTKMERSSIKLQLLRNLKHIYYLLYEAEFYTLHCALIRLDVHEMLAPLPIQLANRENIARVRSGTHLVVWEWC